MRRLSSKTTCAASYRSRLEKARRAIPNFAFTRWTEIKKSGSIGSCRRSSAASAKARTNRSDPDALDRTAGLQNNWFRQLSTLGPVSQVELRGHAKGNTQWRCISASPKCELCLPCPWPSKLSNGFRESRPAERRLSILAGVLSCREEVFFTTWLQRIFQPASWR